MGRKIPGKKHRTIKDPAKQQQIRLDKIKNKINNPPKNSQAQEIPKSLLNLMALKNSVKTKGPSNISKQKRKKKHKKNDLMCVAKVLDKYPGIKSTGFIPNLVQKSHETPSSFIRRMNVMTQKLIEEVEYEKKFGVNIKKNEETGEVIEIKKIKTRRSKKKKLSEIRKEKNLKKKENSNHFKDFSELKDNIKFGEVVERPPTLPIMKNSEKILKVDKNRYSNLLLNKFTEKESADKCIKFSIQKEKADNERKFIVEAYRRAKKKIR